MEENLIACMERHSEEFSKGQRRIAEYIRDHYETAAFMTAFRLGETVGVSESTVVRFAAQLGFTVEGDTAQAMLDLKDRLHLISRERIAAELTRMISSPGAADVLARFGNIFITAVPQCTQLDIPALAALPAGDAILRTAALLHKNGAENVEKALLSLKLPTVFVQECTQLVAHYDDKISPQDVPLWLARLQQTQFERLAQLKDERELLISEMQRALRDNLPLSLKDLSVTGRDLLAAGVPAGPRIGEMLSMLHEKVLRRALLNEKETLLQALELLK